MVQILTCDIVIGNFRAASVRQKMRITCWRFLTLFLPIPVYSRDDFGLIGCAPGVVGGRSHSYMCVGTALC